MTTVVGARHPARVRDFVAGGWYDALRSGRMTQAQAADDLSVTQQAVSVLLAETRAALAADAADAGAVAVPLSAEKLAAIDDFATFRTQNFRVPDVWGHVLHGNPYRTPPFQRRWGWAIDDVLAHPGILLILAPPRCGKSEFLSHKLIQLTILRSAIRGMWVGGNSDIANASVDQVRDELGDNEVLRANTLPGSQRFMPAGRSTAQWTQGKFTVATRTIHGIKSPTLVAVGKGGKILSRDADVIVCDDLVDHASTLTADRRANDWQWFRTQLLSRREPHTSVIVIGSRQHFDDIYARLLADERVTGIVCTAHDESVCPDRQAPTGSIPEHPHPRPGATSPCLLFPELRDIDWLLAQEHSLGRELYEMVYLNRATSAARQMFTRERIEACFDRTRVLSAAGLPEGCFLVAGLDPATVGYQAAFLWAYHPSTDRLFMVDLDNTRGAGIEGSQAVMRSWLTLHGCRRWVVEDNAAQRAYLQDRPTREWAAANGVSLRGHFTGAQKWDQNLGISTLARRFSEGTVNLPYGDEPARRATDAYVHQLLRFEAGPLRHATADIVMASWFPTPVIRSLRHDHLSTAASVRDPEFPWGEEALVAGASSGGW